MEAAGRVRAHNDPGERAAPSAGGGRPTVPGGQGVDGAPGEELPRRRARDQGARALKRAKVN